MSDKAVESVARAICYESCQHDREACKGAVACEHWRDDIPEARAAMKAHLEALRAPSEAVLRAGHDSQWEESWDDLPKNSIERALQLQVWQAMIDSALEDL